MSSWARRASQAGAQDLITRVVSSFKGERCRESKNIRARRQAHRDYSNGLFDTQNGPQRAYPACRNNGGFARD